MSESILKSSPAAPASTVLMRSLVAAGGLVLLLILGSTVTAGWYLRETSGPEITGARAPVILAALVATIALSTVNLLLRWLRWHFLSRRLGARLAAKTSVHVWFATLPAILTPFYLGELVRGAFLGEFEWLSGLGSVRGAHRVLGALAISAIGANNPGGAPCSVCSRVARSRPRPSSF